MQSDPAASESTLALPRPMDTAPCPLCGYAAPILPCPHCGGHAREPSLGPARAGRGALAGALAGLWAVPRGLAILATTPGTKRWLVPPVLLTLSAFALLFAWVWRAVEALLDAARLRDPARLGLEPGWLHDAAAWLIERGVVVWVAHAGVWIVLVVVSSLVAMWTFSIVYEALAGPFLDEIQGRIEKRWFGTDPRDDLERPTDLPASRCALWTAAGLAAGATAALVAWPRSPWLALALVPAPLALLGLAHRELGRWLFWVIRLEGGTLWVSLKASLMAGALMVLFFPLRFLPFGLGYLTFGAVAGFATAITLLDIPFERRQWSLQQRLAFARLHLGAMTAYGASASLLFVIPVLGPILMVPAASVGGLWLVCRLDKEPLRERA